MPQELTKILNAGKISGHKTLKSIYIRHDLAEKIQDRATSEKTSFNKIAERALLKEVGFEGESESKEVKRE